MSKEIRNVINGSKNNVILGVDLREYQDENGSKREFSGEKSEKIS
jgi:hypothetical protein